MAIPLPAQRNRLCFDADHAPDVGVIAREHALGLADSPRIGLPLAPGRRPGEGQPLPGKLDDYIEEIIADGTGKKWELSHNQDWTRHTRPIVEAYFWARYLLDMAIRFAREYDRPPALLDYGWAALLTIYRLR